MPKEAETNRYQITALADIGCGREAMEDVVQFHEIDSGTILAVMADGTGGRDGHPRPAAIAVMEAVMAVQEYCGAVKEHFLSSPCEYLRFALLRANRVLQAFKEGNEELFSGYAASVTCCVLTRDNGIHVAHSGNTRLYVIRNGAPRQLTKDHTKAAERLADGEIDEETYYIHPDRLALTSGIGLVVDPEIQTFSGHIRQNDLVLMTTDGVHYAVRPEYLGALVINAEDAQDAVNSLINAAKNTVKYPDNMSAAIIYDRGAIQGAPRGAGRAERNGRRPRA